MKKTKRFFAMLLAMAVFFTMLMPATIADEVAGDGGFTGEEDVFEPETSPEAPETSPEAPEATETVEPTATPEPTPEPPKDQSAVTVSVAAEVAYGAAVTVTVGGGDGTGAYTLNVDGVAVELTGNTYELKAEKAAGETYALTASRAGDAAYNPSAVSAAATVTVVKAEQSAVTIALNPAQPAHEDVVTVTAAGGNGDGAYVVTVDGTALANGGTFTATAGVTYEIAAYREASANYNQSAVATAQVVVDKLVQAPVVVTIQKSEVSHGALVVVAVSGGTVGEYTLTVDGEAIEMDEQNGAAFFAKAEAGHVYEIVATRAGDELYAAASATTTVTVLSAGQKEEVSIDVPADVEYMSTVTVNVSGGQGSGAYAVEITANGEAVEFTAVDADTFEFVADKAVGTVYVITASREASGSFEASAEATAKVETIIASQKTPITITMPEMAENGTTVVVDVAGGDGTGAYEVSVTADTKPVECVKVDEDTFEFVIDATPGTYYVVSVKRLGDDCYLTSTKFEATLMVSRGQQRPIVCEIPETIEYKTSLQFGVSGGDGEGTYVMTVKSQDGALEETTTSGITSKDVLELTADLPVGTVYEVSVYREGDELHAPTEPVVKTVTVVALPVTVSPVAGMTKTYGVADDAAAIAANWVVASADTEAVAITDLAMLASEELASQLTVTREAAAENGEFIGVYAFELVAGETVVRAGETAQVGNFAVTFDTAEYVYEILPVISLNFASTTAEDGVVTVNAITPRSNAIGYVAGNTAGTAPVWPEVVLTAAASNIADANLEDTISFASTATNGLPVSAKLTAENLTGSLPIAMDRLYTDRTTITDWMAGLPVGSVVTLTATGLDREGNVVALDIDGAADALAVNAISQEVVAGTVAITMAGVSNTAPHYMNGGTQALVRYSSDAGLVITVDSTTDEALEVSVPAVDANGQATVVTYYGVTVGKTMVISAEALINMGVKVGEIPSMTPVTVKLIDTANLNAGEKTMEMAFDSGAAGNLEVVYENRGETMTITLPEPADNGAEVTVTIDGVDVGLAQAMGDNSTTEWVINVKDWMSGANVVNKKLPMYTTDSVITVSYTDRVGNTTEYTTHPVRSKAQKSITIYVDPNPVYDTVGKKEGMKLELYGKATAYEELLVTIGGRSYRVTAKGDGDYAHKTTGRWSLTVDLSEIDFPVNVPTPLTVRYVNISGGSAEVELTYKNWCQPVLVASPMAIGQDVLYGFCEPSSIVLVTMNGGAVYSSIGAGKGMFTFGTVGGVSYYAFYLPEHAKAGYEISVQYIDFVDNESEVYTVTVPETFNGATKAQPLGANIVERLYDEATGEYYADHRFVTPIEVSEGATVEVPVLAFKGYQVGTMTAKCENGQLVFDYAIDEDCQVEGGAYTLRVYTEKPSLKTLLNDETASLDITAPVAIEEGVSTVWVYAEFDVNVSAERIANDTGYIELRRVDDELVADEYGMSDELYEMYKHFQEIR